MEYTHFYTGSKSNHSPLNPEDEVFKNFLVEMGEKLEDGKWISRA